MFIQIVKNETKEHQVQSPKIGAVTTQKCKQITIGTKMFSLVLQYKLIQMKKCIQNKLIHVYHPLRAVTE